MDKRNLVFIFTMLIAFFLINQWYGNKTQEQMLNQKQVEAAFKMEKGEKPSIAVDAQDLPLLPYYTLDEKEAIIGYGLRFNQSFLTFRSKDILKKISIKMGSKFEQMELLFQGDDGFCFYSSNPDVAMNTAFLPQFQEIPVALIPISKDEKSFIKGTYQNQKITLKSAVSNDSIVVVKFQQNYLPIGFYVAKSKRFHLLSEFDDLRDFLSFQSQIPRDVTALEQFYVLENDYQQIVFSNLGGAIAEINLPFANKENKASIVYPVQYDKIIQKQFPFEASFPLKASKGIDANGNVVNYKSKIGGYYPLLRRDLIEKDHDLQSRFYALNLINNGKPLSQKPYKVTRFEKDLIQFEFVDSQRKVIKTYRLPKDAATPYALLAEVSIDGDASGLYLTTGVPEVELIGDNFDPMLQYAMKKKDKLIVEKVKLPKATTVVADEPVSYVANSNGYFGLFLASLNAKAQGYASSFIPGNLAPTRLSVIDTKYDRFPKTKFPGYEMLLPLEQMNFSSNAQSNAKKYTLAFFAGPIENKVLAQVDQGFKEIIADPQFSEAQTYYGWFSFISEPFAKFLFLLMKIFYSFTHSWGLSIILLTLALRLMLYPINDWAAKSSAKMQEIAPKLKLMQEKYKKDPQRYQMEMLKFYRENKINPFSGFLPLFIQLPFMIGMFDLLKSVFQLRGASFIPGWINNLAAPDVVFSWQYPLPFFGNSFHLLPILVGLAMFFQSRLGMPKVKPEEMTDQMRQQRTISTVFMIILPVMFYNFASGLNIYWLFSTLLAIAQQVYTKKRQLA
jgi:YidC/Oxa1 family membrane protein insertase